MDPEKFTMHSTPINKAGLYSVYKKYKDDYTYNHCEEYENVSLAITQVNRELRKLKKAYKQL